MTVRPFGFPSDTANKILKIPVAFSVPLIWQDKLVLVVVRDGVQTYDNPFGNPFIVA